MDERFYLPLLDHTRYCTWGIGPLLSSATGRLRPVDRPSRVPAPLAEAFSCARETPFAAWPPGSVARVIAGVARRSYDELS